MCLRNAATAQWKKIAKEPAPQKAADHKAVTEAETLLKKATDLNKDR
jgi:hypothetical protein